LKLLFVSDKPAKKFITEKISPTFIVKQFAYSYLFGVVLSNMAQGGLGIAGSIMLSLNQSLAEMGIALAEKRDITDLLFVFVLNLFGYILGYFTSGFKLFSFLHNIKFSTIFVVMILVSAFSK
jgi:hypothetical protein